MYTFPERGQSYLSNTSPKIIKVNTSDTDSFFQKSFAKYPFNSEKKTLCQIGLTKAFRFR